MEVIWFDWDSLYYFIESENVDFDAVFLVEPNRRRYHSVRMSAQYTNLDLRREPCDEDRERSKRCKGSCKAKFFFDSFGCWPMFYIFEFSLPGENLSDLSPCQAEDYLNSALVSLTSQMYGECLAQCLSPCVKPVFSDTPESWSPSEDTTVIVRVLSQVYMSIEEQLANDFEGLLSDLGGALGLWLGASFAAVVHIPIFFLQAIADWLIKKKEVEHPSLEMVATVSGPSPTDVELCSHEGLEKRFCDKMKTIDAKLEALEKLVRKEALCVHV